MKNNIYTPDGWLDVPALAARGCWLNVITGPRQVGKTYGTLKYIIEEKRPFILMRRTVEEVQFLGINTEVNPFKVFEPEHEISMDRAGKILNISEEGEIIGICMGLPTVATVRGFSASRFTDIIFDEFIPEKHVIQRKTEGDALLNAYTTINGNRELEGRPPVRLWLLANSNNINSPILTSLGLVDPILRMREKGQEVYQKDGVLIVQPGSMKIIRKRSETAMMKHGMAYVWQRDDGFLYICRAPHRTEIYEDSEYMRERFRDDYWWIFDQYRSGEIRFADLHLLEFIKALFDIKF